VAAFVFAAEYFPHDTVENVRNDWVGWVFPAAGRRVLGAETIGAHAAWFEAVLTPEGPVRVEQAFLFDRELFAPGPDPLLEIGVRLRRRTRPPALRPLFESEGVSRLQVSAR
jgi:hypothetical protein